MVSINNLVIRGGNEAISVNAPSSTMDIHLTTQGSDWLWAAFCLFAFFTIVHAFLFITTSSKTHSIKKSMILLPLFTNAILSYTYFTYASNLGWTEVPVEFKNVTTDEGLGVRQIFYVKYIGWFLAWPFVLLSMEVATSAIELNYNSQSELFNNLFTLLSNLVTKILTVEIFVLGLLIGSLIKSSYKWGYFTFSTSAELFAISLVGISSYRAWKSYDTNKLAVFLVVFQLIVMVLYPINWGLSDGGNRIQPDSEAVFYGILDLITFSFVPSLLTLINTKKINEGFFSRLAHSKTNEKVTETPRQSGDTAV